VRLNSPMRGMYSSATDSSVTCSGAENYWSCKTRSLSLYLGETSMPGVTYHHNV